MIVKLNSEDELFETTKELFHVLVNLRHRTKVFDQKYGRDNAISKKLWESKADLLIQKLQAKESTNFEVNEKPIT